jgi:hypothetical protein
MSPTREEVKIFSMKIQELFDKTGMTYLESMLHYCEEIHLELEVAARLIDESIKSKLEKEAIELSYIRSSSILPLE